MTDLRRLEVLRALSAAVVIWLFVTPALTAPVEERYRLADGTEVNLLHFPASGSDSILWLGDERMAGVEAKELTSAESLAAAGVDVWFVDPVGAYLLPALPSSLDQVPAASVSELIDAVAARRQGVPTLLTTGHGARFLLRGAEIWRGAHSNRTLSAILLYPILYREIVPGEPARYFPIVGRSRLRLLIIQPKLSAGFWWVGQLEALLSDAGSQVSTQVVEGVRDGYFRRPDATDREKEEARQLPQRIEAALSQLAKGENP
jgi:hypothetical protein